jgi:hypothetical protein
MVQVTDFGLGRKSVTMGFGCCTGDVEGIVGFVVSEKVEQALWANYRFRPWAEIGKGDQLWHFRIAERGKASADERTENKES